MEKVLKRDTYEVIDLTFVVTDLATNQFAIRLVIRRPRVNICRRSFLITQEHRDWSSLSTFTKGTKFCLEEFEAPDKGAIDLRTLKKASFRMGLTES